jgi:5'-methylthioadenosine phosphorylase
MESNLKVGIIGGTGLNRVDILKDAYEIEVETAFGKPSDKLLCGQINGVDCVLLSRHG